MVVAIGMKAQTVAMDFTQDDCNGNNIHLYEVLEQNNVVILEFFMTNCNPCINAGNALLPHFNELQAAYPGHVDWYHFGFNNSYSCATVSNWVTSNGFPSRPFTNGANMVAYYGGFGMPTIVVLAGASHEIIFSQVGYSAGDDVLVHQAVDDFFASSPLTVAPAAINSPSFSLSYLSASELLQLTYNTAVNEASVSIFNTGGLLVLQTATYSATNSKINIPVNELANGIYLVSTQVGDLILTKRVSIVR
jgi:thiol-disulfide isomerase/thioredoxin